MPSSEQYPRRRRVPWRVLEGEALVVDPKRGYLYPLNPVGARIWELCDGLHTVHGIVDLLVEEFDADVATIRQDAGEFLDGLAAAGLITAHDAPTPDDTEPGPRGTPRPMR